MDTDLDLVLARLAASKHAIFDPTLARGLSILDEETAGLALAATIAGADEEESDANPFLAEGDEKPEDETPEFNPFLADAPEEG